jgi:hypothetical protein
MFLLQVLYYLGPLFPKAVVLVWEDEVSMCMLSLYSGLSKGNKKASTFLDNVGL